MRYLRALLLLPSMAMLSVAVWAQNAPSSASPSVPSFGSAPSADLLTYSFSASESVLINYNGYEGTGTATVLSGQAAYVSSSQYHPTSFIYSGGYMFGNQPGQPSGAFQNFGISQVLNARRFSFVIGDLVSYLPAAPVFGLSGVPGVGDVGTPPIGMGDIPVGSILSNYGSRVTNTASVGLSPKLTGKTNLNFSGAYTIQRFMEIGQDSDDLEASASLNHRFSERNSVGVGYTYSKFRYSDTSGGILFPSSGGVSMTAQGANLQYEHVFTRKLSFNAAAGPQWISSDKGAFIPKRTTLYVMSSLQYAGRLSRAALSYSRGANPGSGVLLGTVSDNANFTAQHTFSRNWDGGVSANYAHAVSLGSAGGQNTSIDSIYAGVQATRRFGEHFSAYASYNLARQNIDQAPLVLSTYPLNAFNGTGHILGFGVTYIPNPIHLRH